MNYSVGDVVRYRMVKGRGRPGVGEILHINGDNVEIKNSRSEKSSVLDISLITGLYEFKPYNTIGRQLGY